MCKATAEPKTEEVVILDAKCEHTLLISKDMEQEEAKLLEARVEEDVEQENVSEKEAHLNDLQFNKLDELLTQTQMYTEFLLEKMEDITVVYIHQAPFLDETS